MNDRFMRLQQYFLRHDRDRYGDEVFSVNTELPHSSNWTFALQPSISSSRSGARETLTRQLVYRTQRLDPIQYCLKPADIDKRGAAAVFTFQALFFAIPKVPANFDQIFDERRNIDHDPDNRRCFLQP